MSENNRISEAVDLTADQLAILERAYRRAVMLKEQAQTEIRAVNDLVRALGGEGAEIQEGDDGRVRLVRPTPATVTEEAHK